MYKKLNKLFYTIDCESSNKTKGIFMFFKKSTIFLALTIFIQNQTILSTFNNFFLLNNEFDYTPQNIHDVQSITLSSWIKKFKYIKTNKEGASAQYDSIFYDSIISKKEQKEIYKGYIQRYKDIQKKLLNNPDLWLPSNTRTNMIDFEKELTFQPFVKRINAKDNEVFIMRGDLHGDIFSLLAQLEDMKNRKIIDDNFKLQPGVHFITLGDIVDRGAFGAELWATLTILAAANPEQVHLIRGNHEDITISKHYGFAQELDSKFDDKDGLLHKWMTELYNLMPVAIYLGDGNGNYVQLCHGGIEQGYQPAPFLESNKQYQLLGALHRKTSTLKIIEKHNTSSIIANAFKTILPYMNDNLLLSSPCGDILPLGFMWNDFDPYSDNHVATIKYGRGLEYGQEGANVVLKQQESGNVTILGIIRAHQHSNSAQEPMMRNLLSYLGIWNMRKNCNDNHGTVRHIGLDKENKDVYTLNLSPDNMAGNSLGLEQDTTIIVTPTKNWNIIVKQLYPFSFIEKLRAS